MKVQTMTLGAHLPQAGQLGKYQLVATLGQGGMGTVYLALASGFGEFRKLLVVKELRQDLTRQEGFVSMFMNEARLAARLSHPNVVQTFEASAADDRYFLAMEYLDGQSLSTLTDRALRGKAPQLTLAMHIHILCEALEGLHYAHELLDYDGTSLRVVHRDVSPENVFVTYHGQVKVVDFGVAKVANATLKTAPGMFVGKFSYAAPEQVLGDPVDARTDVFAVGVMLWEAIAGRPFSAQTPSPAACRARSLGLEPRIAEVVPGVDQKLAWICDRALAVNRLQRFASAKEFRAELLEYLQETGVRVEAADINRLMHEAFDAERRSIHACIEQAMRHSNVSQSSVEDLTFLHADRVPTAVADLSSLVEVSLEQDDRKIQEGYAQSKVTAMQPFDGENREVAMPMFRRAPRARWVALGAGAALVLAGALTFQPTPRVERQAEAEKPMLPTETTVQAATIAPPAPIPVEPLTPALFEATKTRLAPAAEGPSEARASSVEARPRRKSNVQSTTSRPARVRAKATEPAEATTEPVHAPVPEVQPVATQTLTVVPLAAPAAEPAQARIEAGADLIFVRKPSPVEIDRENPYQGELAR